MVFSRVSMVLLGFAWIFLFFLLFPVGVAIFRRRKTLRTHPEITNENRFQSCMLSFQKCCLGFAFQKTHPNIGSFSLVRPKVKK